MNSKELALRRSASSKRWRIFSTVAGSIGLAVIAFGLAVGLADGVQVFWAFLGVGLFFFAVAALTYRSRYVDDNGGRTHRRHRS